MHPAQEHRTWNGSGPVAVASSWFITLGRPGVLAALSCMLVVASACSKQEKEKTDEKLKSQVSAPAVAPGSVAEQPKPEVKKAPPVVSPGHLPPNPRVPQSSQLAGRVSASSRQQPLQAQPSAAEAAENVLSSPPPPVTDVHTPEQSKQARLQALQTLFRQRDENSRAAQPSGGSLASPAANKSTEKHAPSKN